MNPERSAIYMMNNQLASIRMYAKLQDFTGIKSLFVSYPKKFDTEYKWFKILPILTKFEFETHYAFYIFFDDSIHPNRIEGNINYGIGGKNFTEIIRMRKNVWVSVTEWQIENTILDVLVDF